MNKSNVDPYTKKTEYETVTDNINASKRNWQMIAYMAIVALIMSIGTNYYAISKAHVTPYVVDVDNIGRALAVTEVKETTLTDEKVIRAFIYQYIDMARSVVSDPQTLNKNMRQVYKESINSVKTNFLNDFYAKNDPFVYAQKKGTRHIEPIVFLKESENTYSVEWKEISRNYENEVLSETHYKALVSVIQIPYTNADKYKENPWNPFGLFVTSISWTQLS
jgi:type IV secretion system protein VirB5